jgi:ribonucleoside-diphosphate reductase alpha chain
MMSAAQPFLSGAISKTVNMPRDTTTEDIAKAYFDGWKLGLKALAIYRDGSKESQPLSTSTEGDRAAAAAEAKPRRERLPDTRQSITHKFSVSGHEGYITVGLYPDGRPGELFLTMAKEGSTIGGLMDAFGTSVSMSLQYGVPLEDYVRKFSHMRFEPQGYTKNPDIRIAKSLIDYIFRWLGITFLPGYKEASQGVLPKDDADDDSTPTAPAGIRDSGSAGGSSAKGGQKSEVKGQGKSIKPRAADPTKKPTAPGPAGGSESAKRKGDAPTATLSPPTPDTRHPTPTNGYSNGHTNGNGNGDLTSLLARAGIMPKDAGINTARSEQFADFQSDAPACDNCGSITIRAGNCYLCHNCGSSMGCS